MALRVWLPLNGNLENKGISEINVVSGSPSYKIGKISSQSLNLNNRITFDCPKLANLQTLSICFWGMAEESSTLTSNWQDLLGFSDVSSSGTNGTFRWETTYSSTNGIHWHDNATNAFVNGSHTHITQKGVWCHCCVVFDYEKGKIFTYTNGTLVNTHNHLGGKFNSTGRFYLGETNNIEGRINDVRIYDHALSAKEVKEISQGLILHYKLDGFSGGIGDNILTGTATQTTVLASGTGMRANGTWSQASGGNGVHAVINIENDTPVPGVNWGFQITNNTSGNRDFAQRDQPYKNGVTYTVSWYMRGTGKYLVRQWNTTDGKQMQSKTGSVNTAEWTYYTWTFTATEELETDECTLHLGATGNTSLLEWCAIKMEIGSVATPWTPAPEDLGIDTTKIIDSSGYGNDGEIVGDVITQSTSPRFNIATHLNSSSPTTNDNAGLTYIHSNFELTAPMQMSVCWWAKPENGYGGTTNHAAWCTSISSSHPTDYNSTAFHHRDARFDICLNSASTTSTYLTFNNYTKNEWHYYCVVYDGKIAILYKDGVETNRNTISSTEAPLKTFSNIFIGYSRAGGVWRKTLGSYSDFRIYVTALSAEDILDLYHTPANIDNLGGVHGFEFIEKTPNLLNPDPREWTKESSVTCVWNEETGYFDVNTNRDTSVTSRWGVYTGVPIKPNTAYLFSAEVLDNKSYIGVAGGTSSRSLPSNIISWNGEKRYYYFFTTSSSHTHAWVYLCSKPSETTAGHFKNIYLGEVGEIASIKQNGIFENEDMVEYNENGRITKSGELAGSNFIEK